MNCRLANNDRIQRLDTSNSSNSAFCAYGHLVPEILCALRVCSRLFLAYPEGGTSEAARCKESRKSSFGKAGDTTHVRRQSKPLQCKFDPVRRNVRVRGRWRKDLLQEGTLFDNMRIFGDALYSKLTLCSLLQPDVLDRRVADIPAKALMRSSETSSKPLDLASVACRRANHCCTVTFKQRRLKRRTFVTLSPTRGLMNWVIKRSSVGCIGLVVVAKAVSPCVSHARALA